MELAIITKNISTENVLGDKIITYNLSKSVAPVREGHLHDSTPLLYVML